MPLTLLLHRLRPAAPDTADPTRPPLPEGLPACDTTPMQSVWVHVKQGLPMAQLIPAVAARLGLEDATGSGLVLHGVRKSGGRFEAARLWPPETDGTRQEDFEAAAAQPITAPALRDVVFDQAELLVELYDDRGAGARLSLAESELARRNALVTVGVVRRGGGEKERALDKRMLVAQLPAALGLEEGETAELLVEDPALVATLLGGAVGAGAGGLPSLPLIPPATPEAAEQTLAAAGVGPGSRILVKSAKEAMLLSLRFRVVTGNDRGPRFTRARPGRRGPLLVVEADRFMTVQDVKALMCRTARLPVGGVGRVCDGNVIGLRC